MLFLIVGTGEPIRAVTTFPFIARRWLIGITAGICIGIIAHYRNLLQYFGEQPGSFPLIGHHAANSWQLVIEGRSHSYDISPDTMWICTHRYLQGPGDSYSIGVIIGSIILFSPAAVSSNQSPLGPVQPSL